MEISTTKIEEQYTRGPAKNTYNARYCSVLGDGGVWNHWASRRDNRDPEYLANKCFSPTTLLEKIVLRGATINATKSFCAISNKGNPWTVEAFDSNGSEWLYNRCFSPNQ